MHTKQADKRKTEPPVKWARTKEAPPKKIAHPSSTQICKRCFGTRNPNCMLGSKLCAALLPFASNWRFICSGLFLDFRPLKFVVAYDNIIHTLAELDKTQSMRNNMNKHRKKKTRDEPQSWTKRKNLSWWVTVEIFGFASIYYSVAKTIPIWAINF